MSSEKKKPESQEEQSIEPAGAAVTETGADEAPAPSASEAPSLDDLVCQLEDVAKKADENWERFLRTQAEMENLRRRAEKDLENAHKFALEKFVRDLLPVIDSLELGIQAASGDNSGVEKLREGNELTLKQFQAVFEKFNIVTVNPLGERFNPELHLAMSIQESSDAEPNTVLTVFQKGYVLNGRLLRPAVVVVAKSIPQTPKIDERA